MHAASSVAAAASFMWLGMVVAISFIEAPLKFRAPGVTLPLGLGIGRLVFRALNVAEVVLAAVIVTASVIGEPTRTSVATAGLAVVVLAVQVLVVRPRLSRRSDAVLAGQQGPRSHAHWVYVGLECVKVVALLIAGGTLISG
ncbi:hypothetical protein ACN27E_10215 [Mycobacterium sp. WMMD1722]|uniref:hypothetical protein n=1 Tax=Mycobacterium sp. WMMD1722 TaxID=3404117 RepID=UPI003BF4A1B4